MLVRVRALDNIRRASRASAGHGVGQQRTSFALHLRLWRNQPTPSVCSLGRIKIAMVYLRFTVGQFVEAFVRLHVERHATLVTFEARLVPGLE